MIQCILKNKYLLDHLLLLLCIFLISCNSNNSFVSYYDTGEKKQVYEINKSNLKSICYYKNGMVKSITNWNLINNNKKQQLFYPDGMLCWEGNVNDEPISVESSVIDKFSKSVAYLKMNDKILKAEDDTIIIVDPNTFYKIQTFVDGFHPDFYYVMYNDETNVENYRKLKNTNSFFDDFSKGIYVFQSPNSGIHFSIIYIGMYRDRVNTIAENPLIKFNFISK